MRSPEVHHALMELFVFYLVQLPNVPESLQSTLIRAQDKIYQAYHGEPFCVSTRVIQFRMLIFLFVIQIILLAHSIS